MSLPVNPSTEAASAENKTQPYTLVELGFDTPLRFSSAVDIDWGGYTWLAAEFEYIDDDQPQLRVFNDQTQLGQVAMTEGTSGRTIRVYEGFGNDAQHPNPVLTYEGEMGSASVTDVVTIRVKPAGPLRTPRHHCIPPTFNHLPAPGTRFETPQGAVILEGK